jgi:regulator of protease activity HflC (stomatin/prohibitin superfamily)
MARKRSKDKSTKSGLGGLVLFGAAVLLAAIGFLLKDFYGIRYGFVGSYIWFLAFLITFSLGLFYFAQFLLPLRWQDSWYEGLRLTINYNFPSLLAALRGKVYRKQMPAAFGDVAGELSPGFNRHRAGITSSHEALALKMGPVFTRSAGPGYVNLNTREMVAQVVDVRRHLRTLPVQATTRDGIPLDTTVTVLFQVRQEEDSADSDLLFPYDPGAIFEVNYLDSISTGDSANSWSERIARHASSVLIAQLSRYALDELYAQDPIGTSPVEEIKELVTKSLEEEFNPNGIDIILTSVGNYQLPEEIIDQQFENWRAEWDKRIRVEAATSNAEAQKSIKLARARAQIEIIERITEKIEDMQKNGTDDLAEIVALRMIEAVENAVSDNAVQAIVPNYVLNTLKQVEEWMD